MTCCTLSANTPPRSLCNRLLSFKQHKWCCTASFARTASFALLKATQSNEYNVHEWMSRWLGVTLVVYDTLWTTSTTEIRRPLHWLPVRQRIKYKMALITYNTRRTRQLATSVLRRCCLGGRKGIRPVKTVDRTVRCYCPLAGTHFRSSWQQEAKLASVAGHITSCYTGKWSPISVLTRLDVE